ncbi:hypothetical protein [Aggregatilinea lenta]|uniref:hypothetical protein n=1 Tax=Aggregatilinea lenta TaxID=913108 RepID=UPI0013C345AE|nr:hypothetical protein [Aggregatilinea lenta]
MANRKMLDRIERKLGVPGLVTRLVERLTPTDMQSVLLEVYRQRAARIQPADVLSAYETNRFVRPSGVSPQTLLEWDRTAFANLPDGFEAVALSSVCPLGTSSVVGLVDQNRVVSTSRNTEVVSDSTNVLALECALRRRQLLLAEPKSKQPIHLAASHRLLRAQAYSDPRSVPHFSAFALCSAGQDRGSLQFELSTLLLHAGFFLRALRAFLGAEMPLRLAVTDFGVADREALLTTQLLSPVQERFANVDCVIDHERASGRNYYVDLCFHVYAMLASGEALELVDGGVVDWTQRLLSNAKERCVISAIGSERLCMEFGHQDRQ